MNYTPDESAAEGSPQPVRNDDLILAEYTQLAAIQDEVNQRFIGPDWIEKALLGFAAHSSHSTPICFVTAALDEALELFRSAVPFKWWAQNGPVDVSNSLVELVDILHFGLSQELLKASSIQYKLGERERTHEELLETASRAVLSGFPTSSAYKVLDLSSILDVLQLRKSVVALLANLSQGTFPWYTYWLLVRQLGSDPMHIAGLYRAKAVLNKFRKANGDKEGTYRRHWQILGAPLREDNAVVMSYVEGYVRATGAPPSETELVAFMSQAYAMEVPESGTFDSDSH